MNPPEHADFEALSAFVDGEAPEWADHVAGCPPCRGAAAELRAVAAAVATPPAPAPAAVRDAAVTAALGAMLPMAGAGGDGLVPAPPPTGDGQRRPAPPGVTSSEEAARHRGERERFARRRERTSSWALAGVASVVVAVLGLGGVILSSTQSTDRTETFAGPALDTKAESAVPGAPGAPVADLGDVADAATLRARALGPPPAAATSEGRSSSSANAGAASSATADATTSGGSTATPGASGGAINLVPSPATSPSATNSGSAGASISEPPAGAGAGGAANVAGGAGPLAIGPTGGAGGAGGSATVAHRPCEQQARAREPGLGPLTYVATARQGSVPAYVLGFSSDTNVTLLMLAQDGCAELLRSAAP